MDNTKKPKDIILRFIIAAVIFAVAAIILKLSTSFLGCAEGKVSSICQIIGLVIPLGAMWAIVKVITHDLETLIGTAKDRNKANFITLLICCAVTVILVFVMILYTNDFCIVSDKPGCKPLYYENK